MFTIPLQKTAGTAGALARFAVTDIFIALALAGTLLALVRGRDPHWKRIRIPTQFLLGIALFLPVVGISFFVTETPSRSIVETFAYVVNMILAGMIVFHVRTRRQLERCLDVWEWGLVLVVVGAMIAVVLLFQGNPHTLLTNGPKVTSTFKKSGQLSVYLIGSLPIVWFNLRHRSPTRALRIRRRLLIVATLISTVATGSRTGFVVGGALAFGLFAGPTLVLFLRRRAALKLSSLAFGLMLLVPVFQAVQRSLPFSFQRAASIVMMADDEDGGGSLESLSPSRMYQIQGFTIAVSEHPWTGVGVGDFYTHNTALVPGAWKPHEIHNTYLGVWAETGIVGALALFILLVGVAQAAWQTIAHGKNGLAVLGVALTLSLLAFYVYSFSNFGLRMRHMWGIIGLILALWNVTRIERLEDREREHAT